MLMKVSGLVRLTKDAQLRYTDNGTAILNLQIASSEKYGEKETQLFLDAVAFSKPAEIIHQYAGTKGTQIYLTGKLQTESWTTQDGQKRSKNSMVIEGFDFVSNKQSNSHDNHNVNNSQPQQQPQQSNYQQQSMEYDADSSEVPF